MSLSADCSGAILQASGEWHNTLKVEREAPTTKNTLPSKAKIWWIEQKLYRQAEAGRVQCHQISSTRNAKAASQNEKEKATTRNIS